MRLGGPMLLFDVFPHARYLVSAVAIVASLASTNTAVAQTCQWMISSGGTSNFRNLAVGPARSELAFGDFDGDRKTDVFATAPKGGGVYQWMFSSGGAANFQNLAVGP